MHLNLIHAIRGYEQLHEVGLLSRVLSKVGIKLTDLTELLFKKAWSAAVTESGNGEVLSTRNLDKDEQLLASRVISFSFRLSLSVSC